MLCYLCHTLKIAYNHVPQSSLLIFASYYTNKTVFLCLFKGDAFMEAKFWDTQFSNEST